MSALEKSRHLRQEATAPDLGLEAMIASRFGLDAKGIGGGAPGSVFLLSAPGRVVGIGGGVSVDLFIPNSSAERTGRVVGGGARILRLGCSSSSGWLFVSLLAGSAGRDGSCGGMCLFVGTASLVDFIAARVARLLGSSGAFLGGSGGNFEGSNAGARTW